MNLKFLISICILIPLCLGTVCAADVSSADDSIVSDLPALFLNDKASDLPALFLNDKASDLPALWSLNSKDNHLASDVPILSLNSEYNSLASDIPIIDHDHGDRTTQS